VINTKSADEHTGHPCETLRSGTKKQLGSSRHQFAIQNVLRPRNGLRGRESREQGIRILRNAQSGGNNPEPAQDQPSSGHQHRSPSRHRRSLRSLTYPLIITTFEGKSGDGIDRFLARIKRRIDTNAGSGKYRSEEGKNAEHVAMIYTHCGSRVRKFLCTLDGNWEEEPDRVQDVLVSRYRMLSNSVWEVGRNKLDNLHQRAKEAFEHYIKRTRKMALLCNGRDDLFDELTFRFVRGIQDKVYRVSLVVVVAGIWEQKGRIRLETCLYCARQLVLTDPSYKLGSTPSDSDTDTDTSIDSSGSDSDSGEDDRDRRRKKKKREKEARKHRKRREEKAKRYGKNNCDQLREIKKENEELRQQVEQLQELAARTRPSLQPHAGVLGYGMSCQTYQAL